MSKAREFWIEFGGDPSDDKEVYKRYSATSPFKPGSFSDEVVHTIEYSAYEELVTALEAVNRRLGRITYICESALKESRDTND